ncbi:MAG TPA: hypothetical protein VFR22_14145, partial [Nocardioidaceae bacterium]|nr:hypothetical protein [Nocardioidaceae bacterium]
TPKDATGQALPAEAMMRFTAAEGRIYPLAMTDPEGYERAITLVGLVATELRRSSTTFEAVLAARDDLIEQLSDLAEAAAAEPVALPPDTIVDAASALRCRELQAPG